MKASKNDNQFKTGFLQLIIGLAKNNIFIPNDVRIKTEEDQSFIS